MVSSRFQLNKLSVPSNLHVIHENMTHELSFNVIPNKLVNEKLDVYKYEVGDGFIRSHFNRSYSSEMRDSPDHFVFWSALMQSQKMAYVYMCWRFELPYEPNGEEVMKIWPTEVDCKLSGLLSQNTGVTQDLFVHSLEFKGIRNGQGRCDMELTTLTEKKQILAKTKGAIYLSESNYNKCKLMSDLQND